MNALAKEKVGKYLNTHFVSAFQRVGTFRVAGNQKQGGNVASYFCTADGLVLHAVAGPADETHFLREARWVVETYNLALLENHKTAQQMRAVFRKAHLDRLYSEHGVSPHQLRFPTTGVTLKELERLVDQSRHRIGSNQGKVHMILGVAPLPRLEHIYQIVFEKVLNERISTDPVNVAGR